MYVLNEPRIIFLAHPRTASQAIVKWLSENFKVHAEDARPAFPPLWGDHHGVDLVNLDRYLDRRYSVFCVVRNHWDWVLSAAMKVGGVPTGDPSPAFFEKWIENHLNNYPYIQQIPDSHGSRWTTERRNNKAFWLYPQLSDTVLRYEDLDVGLAALFPDTPINLPKIDALERTCHVSEYYTELAKELVFAQFGEEIEEYGYEFPVTKSQTKRVTALKENELMSVKGEIFEVPVFGKTLDELEAEQDMEPLPKPKPKPKPKKKPAAKKKPEKATTEEEV